MTARDVPALVEQTLRIGVRSVPLLAGEGALAALPSALERAGFSGKLWLIADAGAAEHHLPAIQQVLPGAQLLVMPGDEEHKNLAGVSRIWDWLVAQRAQRQDALVAFGSGIVTDMVGFAAASYLRGVGLVNVPTTLLAQVDASVGGKTGVNHAEGKNLIGAFYQPMAVVADTRFLATLSPRTFAAGLAEIAKIAMAMDADLFQTLERMASTVSPSTAGELTTVIARAIALKAEVVERDERETGERMLLNYGHTIGHAVEAAAGYGRLLHGEAVSVGMHGAAHIAHAMGLLPAAAVTRQNALLDALHLPATASGLDASDVLGRLILDKKRAGARQRWILATRVGHANIHADVPDTLVRAAVSSVLVP